MSESLHQPITAATIIATAKALGLEIRQFEAKYFSLEQMCACPAGIAAIMRDPHLARATFGVNEAWKVLGAEIVCGLVWGYDLGWKPHEKVTDEVRHYAGVGYQVRKALETAS